MEFGLFAVIGVVVLAVIGGLLTKGCCGTKNDKGCCGGTKKDDNICSSEPTKSNIGFEDRDKEKAIDELMSRKDR